MGIFLGILIEVLLTILWSVNTIQIGVPAILDFNIFGLLLTIICIIFGCRHWCRSVKAITILVECINDIKRR